MRPDVRVVSKKTQHPGVRSTTASARSRTTPRSYLCESFVYQAYREVRLNVFDAFDTCEQSQRPDARRYGGRTNRFARSD